MMREAAWGGGVYVREIGVYRDLLPILKEIRGDKWIPLDASKLYYARSDDKDHTCLLLEDLKAKGYRVTDKVHGCDYQHALLTVTSLANYHALTMAAMRQWKHKDPITGKITVNYPDGVKFLAEKTILEADPVFFVKGWLGKYIEFTQDLQRPDVIKFSKNFPSFNWNSSPTYCL